MRRWTVLAAVVAAGAIVVGVNPAASATRIDGIYCELRTDSEGLVRVDARAYYTDNGDTGIRNWYRFDYHIGGVHDRTKNNMNIRVSESGRQVYAWNSPDNRHSSVWYTHTPTRPVHTSIYGPSGEHDHRSNDLIELQGIFDFDHDADPRCTAWTKR
jgi:hypothetical protein